MKLSRSRFVAGFITASLIFSIGAFAASVNNSPQGGYLLCANKKTKAVTFPGTLKCPNGSTEIIVPGSDSNISNSQEQSNSDSNTSPKSSSGSGSKNCNLAYLQANPDQVNSILDQCSSTQLGSLVTELNKYENDSQALIEKEQKKLQDLQKTAKEKAGQAGADEAQAAVAAQATAVAELIAKVKSNITLLTNIIIKIQKKVKA